MTAKIAYYISSHGYGHAARQQAVINQLAKSDVEIIVRTATPKKFFKRASVVHPQRYDIGMIQSDALHMDVEASLQWMADFLKEEPALIEQEIAFIKTQDIDLIVSDMPPIACEIATRAGIPSIVMTHFTWDWVYEHYMDDYPQYRYIVDHLKRQYHQATLALQMQLPIPHNFDMFPHVEPLALVHNPSTQSRAEVRQAFNIPDEMAMILLSMGGHRWGTSNIDTLRAIDDAIFLVMPDAWEQVQDDSQKFRYVPMDYDNYHDLIAAADCLVGKAGGSTVAEVIGHRTPMIYTTQSRKQWREIDLLTETLDTVASSYHVPIKDFLAGAWVDHLPTFLKQDHHWADVDTNGAQQAARRIIEML